MEARLPHPCPACGTTALTLRTTLVARPLGSFSLAGAQTKISAVQVAEVRCAACGASRRGRLEGVQTAPDGKTITAGHFVAEEE